MKNYMDCPVCRCKRTRQLDCKFRFGDYLLFKCEFCGLKFIVSEDYQRLDDDIYWDDVNKMIYNMPSILQEFRTKQYKYLNMIKMLSPPNKNLLDVGCGNGIFLKNSETFGYLPIGIEPSEIAIELCKRQYGKIPVKGYLGVDSNLPKDFGILSAWDVIEHVSDPREFLRICNIHLRKNGILLLETPDESSLIRKLISIVDYVRRILNIGGSSNIYYPSHRYYFTHKSIKLLLRSVGFSNTLIFKERSIYSKSIAKLQLYRKLTKLQLIKYKIIFYILKCPIFWNKQVILCKKQ